ncbi:MAG: DUF2281 domain-containing protein [Saprospiraceae bacterium]|nr:DUF2281 domain-containing protein [Candidatus Opimibacter skivensis]
MTNTSLKMEINSLPKELRDEVAGFVAKLKKKARSKPKLTAREFGLGKGKIELAKDFDQPIQQTKV